MNALDFDTFNLHTVEPSNSVLQNSGKPRISGKFSNDKIFPFLLLNLQNSGKLRNSGRISADRTFRYCGVLLYVLERHSIRLTFNSCINSRNTYYPISIVNCCKYIMLRSTFWMNTGTLNDHRTKMHRKCILRFNFFYPIVLLKTTESKHKESMNVWLYE